MSVLTIRRPEVVAEEIDGEVIAIDLDTGAYYSFRGVASIIWQYLLMGPSSGEAVTAALRDRYAEAPDLELSVSAFLRRMVSENLLTESENAAPAEQQPVAIRGAPEKFAVPIYEKHTDMEEFLLVDPIHDLDVSRWPEARPSGPDAG